jgi:hypothetical protein
LQLVPMTEKLLSPALSKFPKVCDVTARPTRNDPLNVTALALLIWVQLLPSAL